MSRIETLRHSLFHSLRRSLRERGGRVLLAALLAAQWGLAPESLARGRGADGEFEERRSSHFVLLQDVDIDESAGLRGSRRFEQDVLDALEWAYDDLHTLLGLRPKRPITVVVHDPALFDAQFAGLFRFAAAGFYSGTIHIRGDTRVHTPLLRVLRHEMVHAALHDAAPTLHLPAWFNEGLAEWFESRASGKRGLVRGESRALEQRARAGGLFSLADLAAPSFQHFAPDAVGLAYLQSYAFMEHLVRLRGERRLRDFLAEYVRSRDLERASRRIYRKDLAALEAGFVADLRGEHFR